MSQQHANIAYNTFNGTILSHQFLGTPEAVNISSFDLLQTFMTLLGPTKNINNPTYLSYLNTLGLGNNNPAAPLIIWEYFQGLKVLQVTDPQTTRRAVTGLQSLTAIPIYHCQPKDFAELRSLLLGLAANRSNPSTQALGQSIVELFPEVVPNVAIYPALERYNLQVGHQSLLAYTIVAGLALAVCLAAQLASSFTKLDRKVRHLSSIPTRNILTDFEIRDAVWKLVPMEDFRKMNKLSSHEKLKAMADMRIVLIARS
jgi:hypothetical protein